MNVTWDDDYEDEKSETESLSESVGKFITFKSRSSKISSVQGSSDRDSKSDEDLNLHETSDDDQDLEVRYVKL